MKLSTNKMFAYTLAFLFLTIGMQASAGVSGQLESDWASGFEGVGRYPTESFRAHGYFIRDMLARVQEDAREEPEFFDLEDGETDLDMPLEECEESEENEETEGLKEL